jgi:hypothetical protein
LSEVTTKRGLASPPVNSALATTRRSRLQLRRVVHLNSLKYRAGLPVRRLSRDLGDQPGILLQAEQKVHAVRLAPGHQRLLRKAAVGTQQNACARPAPADLRDNARHLLNRIRRGTHARGLQPSRQQMTPAEYVKR